VLDAAILLFALRAVRRAGALRWWSGVGLALGTLGLWAAVAVAGWHEHAAERFTLVGAFILMFLGPASIGTGGAAGRAFATTCAIAGFVLAHRRHARIPPMLDASVPWGDAAIAFLPPIILTLGQQIIFLLTRLMD